MLKKFMKQPKKMSGNKKSIAVIATTITTLLSASIAFIAIKRAKNVVDKSEVETVLDVLVDEGTITQAQQIAIQSAIITAKEERLAVDELAREENVVYTTTPGPSKTGTLTKIKKSLYKVVGSEEPKKSEDEMAI